MMKKLMAVMLILSLALVAQAEDKQKKKGKKGKRKRVALKCPISGKAIKKEHAVAFKGGKVFFCCPNCPKAFKASDEKHATKANHQLVASRQFRQTKCPISGGKLDRKTTINVAGARVAFCCNNCKGKVSAAKGDAQLALAFSEKAFTKAAFKKAKPRKKKKKKADS